MCDQTDQSLDVEWQRSSFKPLGFSLSAQEPRKSEVTDLDICYCRTRSVYQGSMTQTFEAEAGHQAWHARHRRPER